MDGNIFQSHVEVCLHHFSVVCPAVQDGTACLDSRLLDDRRLYKTQSCRSLVARIAVETISKES